MKILFRAARHKGAGVDFDGVYTVGHSELSNEGRWVAAVLTCDSAGEIAAAVGGRLARRI